MDEKPVVLVAARQAVVRRLVAAALQPAGFSVASGDVGSVLSMASDFHPDVLIVEATEPQSSTHELLRDLRAELSLPILVMSPLATPTRVAPALDAGADDYIARPFASAELAARIRALVRRRGDRLRAGLAHVGGAVVDLATRRISGQGGTMSLSRAEWTLLTVLLANEGRVMFCDELVTAAFGPDHRGDVSGLQLSIGRLRRKLGLQAWEEGPIRTLRGIGYAYDPRDLMPRLRSRSLPTSTRLPAALELPAE